MTEDWIIGFIWANGKIREDTKYKCICIQNKNRELLLEIASFLGMDSKEMTSGVGVIDINHEHLIYKKVMDLGWTSHWNCCYPLDHIDDLEFTRGYCKTKAYISYGTKGVTRKNKRYLRFQIRGADPLLFEMNNKIMSWIGSKPRIVQRERTGTRLLREDDRKGRSYFIAYADAEDVHALSKLLAIPLPDPDKENKKIFSLDDAREIAEARGGKCLSTEYLGWGKKLKWQCAEGHIWETIPSLIKNRNAWCPACASSKRRLAIEEMQKLAESKGGKCLSDTYVNSRTELKWQCEEGHIWETTPDTVKYSGIWCTICSRKSTSNMKAGASSYAEEILLEMQKLAETNGGKCLSNAYVNLKTKLKWQCAKGHTWEAVPYQMRRGTWCPVCDREKRMPTIEEMHQIAKARGGECLSVEYVHSKTKLKWQCAEGHVWEAEAYQVKGKGTWCPICFHAKRRLTIEKMQEAASAKGGKCLSDTYEGALTKLKWQCANGHVWETTPSKVIHSGSWCKKCYNESQRKKLICEKV